LEVSSAFGAATLRCVPKVETLPASQQIPGIVKLADRFVAAIADEPGTMAAEIASAPAKRDSLGRAASKLYIDAPFVGGQPNQSWPSERDHGVRNQRLSKRAHAIQDVNVKGLKMLNRAVGSHWASAVLSVILASFVRYIREPQANARSRSLRLPQQRADPDALSRTAVMPQINHVRRSKPAIAA
jgi:hypothetical protein